MTSSSRMAGRSSEIHSITGEFVDPAVEGEFLLSREPALRRAIHWGWVSGVAGGLGLAFLHNASTGDSLGLSLLVRVVVLLPGILVILGGRRLDLGALTTLSTIALVWAFAGWGALLQVFPNLARAGAEVWSLLLISVVGVWRVYRFRYVVLATGVIVGLAVTPWALEHASDSGVANRGVMVNLFAIGIALGFGRANNMALRQTQLSAWENEELTRARSRLLAAVAHELRTPIAAVDMGLAALTPKHADERLLPVLSDQVGRLSRLVDGVLRLGRLTSADKLERHQEVRCDELVMAVVADLRALHDDVTIEATPVTDVEIRADIELLRSALTGLGNNAIRHADEAVRFGVVADEGQVRFSVDDDGPGVPPDDRERIFEPLFKRSKGGTGLGLTIALRIATGHGGDLVCGDSELGGARMVLSVPR